VINFDQSAVEARVTIAAILEAKAVRHLIREKLKDGRLPYDSMPRFWGGASNDERCDACDATISKEELVMEGIASTPSNKKPSQFPRRLLPALGRCTARGEVVASNHAPPQRPTGARGAGCR
jgi:hypothetical protein